MILHYLYALGEEVKFARYKRAKSGVNPTKLFSLLTEYFFHFFLLRLAISKYRQYFLMLQTLKLNNKNLKNEEIKVW